MPRKGINICRRCRRYGVEAGVNNKGEVICVCHFCGNKWKSKARFINRDKLPKVE